jgi:multidrug resistance protein
MEHDEDELKRLSTWHKWLITVLLGMSALHATALNSAWGVANDDIVQDTKVNSEVSTLGISLFVIIAGIGPLVTAPLSEFYGRRPVYLVGFAGYVAFQAGSAFGRPFATVLVCRCLCAVFAGIFLANVGGSIADIFEPGELGPPMTVFTLGSFNGPTLGPVISGVVVQRLGWRWVFYIFLIWAGVLAIANVIFVPETRRNSEEEKRKQQSVLRAIVQSIKTPFVLMRKELMLDILCLYSGFLMAVVYLFLVAFPLIFQEVYGFGPQGSGLAFLSLAIGITVGGVGFAYYSGRRRITNPEAHLSPTCIGGVLAPIGLLAFAWTIYPSVHWTAPMAAAAIFGLGYYTTFNAILAYIVAAYPRTSASAVAVNVFVRGVLCGAFPLFGRQLFESSLGFHWATSLIGFIALLLSPVGFLFKRYGYRFRQR